MKEIEVKVIDGKTCVKARDLKPNPTNEKIYDQSAMNDIGQSMMKRKQVDDYQFGGGAGMVLQAKPLIDATRYVKSKLKNYKCIYLSPKGTKVTQEMIVNTTDNDNLIIIAGRYEGVDQRFIDLEVDEEWSIGDYILSGGEVAACVVIDAVARMIPGVLGHEDSNKDESFSKNLSSG